MSAASVPAGRTLSAMEEPQTETDHIMPLKRQRNRRTLHFSDGTEDVSDSESSDEVDAALEHKVDEKNLTLTQRMRRRMKRVGTGILAGIDYVGGEVASLLGMGEPVDMNKMRKKPRKGSTESDEIRAWSSGGAATNNNSTEPLTAQPRASNSNELHTVTITQTAATNNTHSNENLTAHASASNNQQLHEHLSAPDIEVSVVQRS